MEQRQSMEHSFPRKDGEKVTEKHLAFAERISDEIISEFEPAHMVAIYKKIRENILSVLEDRALKARSQLEYMESVLSNT